MDEQKKELNEDYIHDCHINYADNVKEGVHYLESYLNQNEFHTLFEHAKLHREAYFQDRAGYHYKIKYREGEYYIERV